MNAEPLQYWARCFGLLWQSDIEIKHLAGGITGDLHADILVRKTCHLIERHPIHRINRGLVYADGFRFRWDDFVTFDMFDGDRIEYCPGLDWAGVFPWPFYSTVAALLLAWRSRIPFHGSAVVIDGQGMLICGDSGAGKSSLAAALVSEGAEFLSDDLSVVVPDQSDTGWDLVTGRPGIRLFPKVGEWLFGDNPVPLQGDVRDKVILSPQRSEDDRNVPLRHVVFLGQARRSMSEIDRFVMLRKNLFRPNWLAKLPTISVIQLAVRDISASVHMSIEPAIGETDEQKLRHRALATMDKVRSAATAST
jgi:hypothetical protein